MKNGLLCPYCYHEVMKHDKFCCSKSCECKLSLFDFFPELYLDKLEKMVNKEEKKIKAFEVYDAVVKA